MSLTRRNAITATAALLAGAARDPRHAAMLHKLSDGDDAA